MPIVNGYRLGRDPSPFDPRTLRMARYLDVAALLAAPTVTNWAAKVTRWGAMLNDKLGCCTISAIGHALQVWTANDGPAQVTVPDSAILTAYSAVSGYRPGKPSTDRGANMLAALKYWRTTGIGGHKDIGYVGVDPTNLDQVRAALWLFGGLYGGCQIPGSWLSGPWDKVSGGNAGGHAWWLVDRNGEDFVVQTWGELRRFSRAGWRDTMGSQPDAELYAVLGPEWTGADAMAPSGFDRNALENDLAEIAGEPLPHPVPVPVPTPPPDPQPTPTPAGLTVSVASPGYSPVTVVLTKA